MSRSSHSSAHPPRIHVWVGLVYFLASLVSSLWASAAPPTPRDNLHDWLAEPRKSVQEQAQQKKLKQLCTEVDSVLAEFDKLQVKIGIRSIDDDSGAKTVQQLQLPVDVTKGYYPVELRVNVDRSVRYENGVLKDDVGRLLVNIDYSFSPRLETYGFVERFSDSYLGIGSRYEVGVGIRIGPFALGKPKPPGLLDDATVVSSALATSPEDIQPMLREVESSRAMIADKLRLQGRLAADLAFSVFEETEQAELTAKVLNGDTLVTSAGNRIAMTEDRIVRPTASNRFRFVLRPRVFVRLAKGVGVTAFTYLKLAWPFEPYYQGKNRDWRADTTVEATTDLGKDEKVQLAVRYEQWFDNAPPVATVPASTQIVMGEGRHERVSIGVSFIIK